MCHFWAGVFHADLRRLGGSLPLSLLYKDVSVYWLIHQHASLEGDQEQDGR